MTSIPSLCLPLRPDIVLGALCNISLVLCRLSSLSAGVTTVILTQERPRSTSARPEGWELPSQRPHFVTLDATNLDDCVEGMEQFLRMKEAGPKEPPSSSGDRE